MSSKKSDTKSKAVKAVKPPTLYTWLMYGGALKTGIVAVGVGYDHPEVELEKYKLYFGNDVKGYYCKCTKSLETVKSAINDELNDSKLNDLLFKKCINDTKKILRDATEAKTCSSMNVNTIEKDEDTNLDEESNIQKTNKTKNSKPEQESDSESEPETIKKTEVKQVKKSKSTKEAEPESEPEVKQVKKSKSTKEVVPEPETKTIKKSTKEVKTESEQVKKISSKSKNSKSSKKTNVESDNDSDDVVETKKINKTSIVLSDDSDEEEEN